MQIDKMTNNQPSANVDYSNHQAKAPETEIKELEQLMTGKKLIEKGENSPYAVTVSEKVVIEAIERANKALEGVYTSFEFSIHEKTRAISVKVLNRDTHEVIREIPPERILDLVAKMWEMAGILVDEKR